MGGLSRDALVQRLSRDGIEITEPALQMIASESFMTNSSVKTSTFLKASIKQLGFETNPNTKDVFERVHQLGFSLCAPEAALWLRIDDKSQPPMNWYWIGMQPIADSRGYARIFKLARGGGADDPSRSPYNARNALEAKGRFCVCVPISQCVGRTRLLSAKSLK